MESRWITSNFISTVFCLCSLFSFSYAFNETNVTTPIAVCNENGIIYQIGETFSRDACHHCTCADGGLPMCYIIDCVLAPCVDVVNSPDQCCSFCPNGPNCRALDGSILPTGQEITLLSGQKCRCPENTGGMMGYGGTNDKAVCTEIQPVPLPPPRIRRPFRPPFRFPILALLFPDMFQF